MVGHEPRWHRGLQKGREFAGVVCRFAKHIPDLCSLPTDLAARLLASRDLLHSHHGFALPASLLDWLPCAATAKADPLQMAPVQNQHGTERPRRPRSSTPDYEYDNEPDDLMLHTATRPFLLTGSKSNLPDIVPSVTRAPVWGCTCGQATNWRSRIRCRCGRYAPDRQLRSVLTESN